MNKKALACLFGLVLAVCMNAGVVSQQMAENLAVDFLGKKISQVKGGSNSLDLELSMEQSVINKNNTVPLFYVFNYGQDDGFIIMSANDATQPVLGWSDRGSFDPNNISDGLQYLIDHYTEALKLSASDKLKSSGSTEKNATKSFTGQRLLQTAEWGQAYPFNNKLPNNFLTGCGATAVSIVMKYFNWPDVGEGEYSVYNKIIKGYLATRLTTYYDWNNMPVYRQQTYSTASVKALSELLYDVSVCLKTDFNTAQNGGSSSSSYYSTYILPKFFKYKRCAIIDRDSYTDQKWDSILHVEIDSNRPVLFSGNSANKTNGHAFVIDGYDSDLYHINFGWNGNDNGYYALSNLIPVTNNMYDFSYNQNAVIHIEPDKNVHNYTFSPVMAEDNQSVISSSVKCVKKNQEFDLYVKQLFSFEKREAYVALMNDNLEVKELIGSCGTLNNGIYLYKSIRCKSRTDADTTDVIGIVTFDPYNNGLEIVDYAVGDNPTNKHCWVPAYNYDLKYYNISYNINRYNVKASLYNQKNAIMGFPFRVIVQPTNAPYFSKNDSVIAYTDNQDDDIRTGTLIFSNNKKTYLGRNFVFEVLPWANSQDVKLHLDVVSTSETENISADPTDNRIFNLNGYEMQSADAPGIYILNGIKMLKE